MYRKCLALVGLFVLSNSVTAAVINGLDWLSLTATAGQSLSNAESLNPEYRLATNDEVVSLFTIMFDGFYDTSDNGSGYSASWHSTPHYDDQLADIAAFQAAFGITAGIRTQGFYFDEDHIARLLGVFVAANGNHAVLGPEELGVFSPSETHTEIGVYMVSNVPLPAAAWLFGSGLIGLVGIAKRRKS